MEHETAEKDAMKQNISTANQVMLWQFFFIAHAPSAGWTETLSKQSQEHQVKTTYISLENVKAKTEVM